ncbi:uncharacterized protein slam isoform X4 [Dermacentor andersoni]|nr:uncharacterized protein LOC126531658 isoform X3 [Dermacentor andersoni]XP_054927322.1 uncharacterized protein LOC126531658 isoform X4 [Dermacentor andersoni]XP_054927323.1 uncharacterized protein LOC126531658 isoform X4 [Dermacentor andersoni]
MSTVAAKRERRKKPKPKLSFGSSSGASGNLPSNMQANLPELFALLKMQQVQGDDPPCEVNGNVTGWSAHKRSLKDDLLMYSGTTPNVPNSTRSSPDSTTVSAGVEEGTVEEEVEPEPLTEADVTDIVRQLREVLQENGPSQEDDLLKALAPEQACRVLATYDTLTAFLDRHPGFRQLHEDLHSFIYYQDPDDDDDDDCYCPTVPLYNGVPALNAGAEHQLHSLVTGDSGPRSVRSSCSSTSYESAMEEEEDYEKGKGKKYGRKDGSSQTPSRPRCQSRALQAVQLTCDAEAQTQGWDPAQFAEMELLLRKRNTEISQLQERLASVQEEHAREMQQLRLKIEELQKRPLVPQTPPPQNEHSTLAQANQELRSSCSTSDEEEDERPRGVATMNGEAEEEEEGHGWPQAQSPAVRRSPLARAEPDEKLHALSIEPKPKPAPPAEQKVKRPAERPQVPEFYDLHWRMEQAAAPCSDVESMWSSRGGSPTKSKTEMQIAKIVHMVKKKQPDYAEQEIRRHVDYLRKIQGGFSRMTFNSIVALVLGHMKSNAE